MTARRRRRQNRRSHSERPTSSRLGRRVACSCPRAFLIGRGRKARAPSMAWNFKIFGGGRRQAAGDGESCMLDGSAEGLDLTASHGHLYSVAVVFLSMIHFLATSCAAVESVGEMKGFRVDAASPITIQGSLCVGKEARGRCLWKATSFLVSSMCALGALVLFDIPMLVLSLCWRLY
ncbi:uncharacterized protein LOC123451069 [Hordeum vulgare subsp. vulgare]|uniref:uncharacterized protein LOC123451069 n=1 Tax=Hordeum vulgare subsp. vulgare TaxID=112509 RepID=UPI001D1A5114|nr:uncharacterized protein LOC123451069 [Hordeum vulgare subsp. vulgare]